MVVPSYMKKLGLAENDAKVLKNLGLGQEACMAAQLFDMPGGSSGLDSASPHHNGAIKATQSHDMSRITRKAGLADLICMPYHCFAWGLHAILS
mmetsp:Transcript_29852/g.88645  ORF Transcript_29852/g.88645 Transcript_29852/m.88645 type:complete len:94 (-) Transcript_29852:11548-11829(-)